MQLRRKLFCFALFLLAFAPISALADDLKDVLQRLDAAARDFHTTSANFEFDAIQTLPVPDTDVMTGVTYYERKGNHFQWAAHVHEHNSQPSHKTYIFSNGIVRTSDTGKASDAKTYDQWSKYESYFMLGFGASGKELADKWNIQYLGTEKLDGITTDKLELIAKDPTVRNNILKVTIWMDTSRAVSLKLVFDEGQGQSRVCHYTNLKVNQPLPDNAFSFDK
jgi:outer membrane lipoprotein-sorting protein